MTRVAQILKLIFTHGPMSYLQAPHAPGIDEWGSLPSRARQQHPWHAIGLRTDAPEQEKKELQARIFAHGVNYVDPLLDSEDSRCRSANEIMAVLGFHGEIVVFDKSKPVGRGKDETKTNALLLLKDGKHVDGPSRSRS